MAAEQKNHLQDTVAALMALAQGCPEDGDSGLPGLYKPQEAWHSLCILVGQAGIHILYLKASSL